MNRATFFKHFDLLAGQPHAVAVAGVRPSPVAATPARTRTSELSQADRTLHLAAPGDGRTPDDARWHAGFVLREFPELTATPEDIPQLRQAILQLAVTGRLVPQNPKDESAELLIRRLAQTRGSYAKANRLKLYGDKPIAVTPFPLPPNWKWARLASLFNAVTDGDHLPPPRSENGVAFLTIGNITTGSLSFADCRIVPQSYFDELASFRRPKRGDILYTVVGATYGRPALVEQDRPFCVQRHIAIFKSARGMDVGYSLLMLKSPLIYEQATANTTGTAQPTVPLGSLRDFLVPVPPLAEQKRIVARVEELMRQCDALEAQLGQTRTLGAHLLESTLHHLLAA